VSYCEDGGNTLLRNVCNHLPHYKASQRREPTAWLTPRSRFVLEKLVDLEVAKKCPAYYWPRPFITFFITDHNLSLSQPDQSISRLTKLFLGYQFVGVFATWRNANIRFVMSVYPSALNNLAHTGRIFRKFDIWVFYLNVSRIFNFFKIWQESPTLCVRSSYICDNILLDSSQSGMFQTRFVEKIKTHFEVSHPCCVDLII
jgi:hypothetical protein